MTYQNGRAMAIKDRVVVYNHPSGIFVGTVSALEGEHLRVHPLFASSAVYANPDQTLRLDDALRVGGEIPQIKTSPSTAPAPAAPPAAAAPEPEAPAKP